MSELPNLEAEPGGPAYPSGSQVVDSTRPMRGLGRQGLLNAASIVLPGLYGILATGAILRTLGPEAYGPWAAVVALLGWLALLDLGLAQTVVRATARAFLGDEDAVVDVNAAAAVYLALGAVTAIVGSVLVLTVPGILGLPITDWGTVMQVGIILALDAAIVLATAPWPGILRGTGRFGQLLASSVAQVAIAVPILVLLLPSIGLAGAAIAQVMGRIAGRSTMALLIRRDVDWFRVRPRAPSRAGIWQVARFSAPLFLMQVATQIGTGTDVLIVGATAGATAAGLFAAGAQLVRYLAYLLFPIIDVVFPRLASIEYLLPRLASQVLFRSLFLAGSIGTVAFGGLALESRWALETWAGTADALSVSVLVLYALAYLIITPAHVLVIALIARGQHRTVAFAILAEALANLILSIVLVNVIGPVGPALSTLVVVTINDLFVIPWVAARETHASLLRLVAAASTGVALGLLVLAVTHTISGAAAGSVVLRAGLGAALLGAVVALGLRWTRTPDQ